MAQRTKRKKGKAGAFDFSSTRSYYNKAQRERDRFNNTDSLIDKTDYFVNFCVAVSAAVDWFANDLKSTFGASAIPLIQTAFKGTAVEIVRDIGNRFKHGPREDRIEHAVVKTVSVSFPITDGNINLTRPDIAPHLEADIIEITMEEIATVTARTLKVRTADGNETNAWTLMQTSLKQMNAVFLKPTYPNLRRQKASAHPYVTWARLPVPYLWHLPRR